MAAMIAMAVFDLENAGRTELTERTLQCLLDTVDFDKHRIFIIDNNSCHGTTDVIAKFAGNFSMIGTYHPEQCRVISNNENVGTAKAINQALVNRRKGEYCIKLDNDVIIHAQNWVEQMEEAIERQPKIGILGLKRKDLGEDPNNTNEHFKTTLIGLPHVGGQRWITFEQVKHGVMGTCTMYNYALLDKIGFLYQPTVYGWDDGLISTRSKLAGFINGFLPHIEMDHIDPGTSFYQKWKEDHAAETGRLAWETEQNYLSGLRPIYEPA